MQVSSVMVVSGGGREAMTVDCRWENCWGKWYKHVQTLWVNTIVFPGIARVGDPVSTVLRDGHRWMICLVSRTVRQSEKHGKTTHGSRLGCAPFCIKNRVRELVWAGENWPKNDLTQISSHSPSKLIAFTVPSFNGHNNGTTTKSGRCRPQAELTLGPLGWPTVSNLHPFKLRPGAASPARLGIPWLSAIRHLY